LGNFFKLCFPEHGFFIRISPSGTGEKQGDGFPASRIFFFSRSGFNPTQKKLILTGLTLIIPKKKVKHFSILSRDSNGLILWVPFTFGNATGSSPQQSSQLQLREQEDTCHGKK
jgi:hypothetical protein